MYYFYEQLYNYVLFSCTIIQYILLTGNKYELNSWTIINYVLFYKQSYKYVLFSWTIIQLCDVFMYNYTICDVFMNKETIVLY